MTEPTPTGALACPFVAFEDDRDARADVPDHRHRCYAEIRPAPRAIAHQEAFCLSPGFAACPTFQDWARREAARAKPVSDRNELAGLARPGRGGSPGTRPGPDDEAFDDRRDDARDEPDVAAGPPSGGLPPGDLPPARSRSRDWAAPPAWAGAGPDHDAADDADAPAFLAGAAGGAAGSGADRRGAGLDVDPAAAGLAGSRWLNEARSGPDDDPELADLDRSLQADRAARQAHDPAARRPSSAEIDDYDEDEVPVRPVASAVASPGRRANQVSRRLPPPGREGGRPAWERSRRNEAYPTLKTRMGMPAIPRVALAAGVLVLLVVGFFALPFLLNFGGAAGPTTPPVSAGPSDSSLPSTGPSSSVSTVASPQVYTVVSGDTITKIAKRFGITNAALLAANPQIKNANNIKAGDKLTIPSPAPSDQITGASPGAS